MENFSKNLIRAYNNRGMTLMEIMVALLILGFAFLPIIGVIGTSTKDTDVTNSYVFAQTTARNILDTLLDDIAFNSIKEGTAGSNMVAKLYDYKDHKVDSFLSMIGSSNENAEGQIMDERGTTYTIKIYCFPIPVTKNSNVDANTEILFNYLPRPKYEGNSAEESDKFYTFEPKEENSFLQPNSQDPYTMEEGVATQTIGAYDLGARPNDANNANSEYYIMKKILFQMTWKSRDGHDRRLELFTMKANLDSEANK